MNICSYIGISGPLARCLQVTRLWATMKIVAQRPEQGTEDESCHHHACGDIAAGTLLLLVLTGGVAAAEEPKVPKPDPLFSGLVLPDPPQQGQLWTPPASKLSQKWLDGARRLVAHGYANPRGCEYREARLSYGGLTHAWIIPNAPNERADAARFAVTWDGLVYPIITLGPAANVKKDVEALLLKAAKHKRRREKVVGGSFDDATGFGSGGFMEREDWVGGIARCAEYCDEPEVASRSSLLGIKSCTLMLLGEHNLAERLWNMWIDQGGAERQGQPAKPDDQVLVEEWAWSLFLRAVDAHRRGDDVIATHDAKQLVELWKGQPTHPFFADWPQRIADDAQWRLQTRRAAATNRAKSVPPSQRAADLVRNLEFSNDG